jgi:hypothetical protein
MVAVATTGLDEAEGDPRMARLRDELDGRDEIIVALQHVIRDLRHEIENLRAERVYLVLAGGGSDSDLAGLCGPPPPVQTPAASGQRRAARTS